MNVITFFKTLKPEDWTKQVTEKWTVKDVLSHLVGWEREVALELPKTWATQIEPWFMVTEDYTEFNRKVFEEFKDHGPERLLEELGKWEAALKEAIEKIGEDNIRQRPRMSWVFDEGDEPHFEHHLQQINRALDPSLRSGMT